MNILKILLPTFFVIMALVMVGNDLGNAAIFALVLTSLLFISGIQLRALGAAGIVVFGAVAGLIITAPNRMHRLPCRLSSFSPEFYKLSGWQPAHSIMGTCQWWTFWRWTRSKSSEVGKFS